jgi:hypothetical protein
VQLVHPRVHLAPGKSLSPVVYINKNSDVSWKLMLMKPSLSNVGNATSSPNMFISLPGQ